MPRRNPIILLVLVAFTLIGLVAFSKSFEASAALKSVQRVVPEQLRSKEEVVKEAIQLETTRQEYESSEHGSSEHGSSEHGSSGSHNYNVEELAAGKPIMAKMPNQTVRAEVGRAGWKLLHTILSQYPETPSKEEKATLETYIKFFSRVYPCQECATHFQALLKKYPPQLSSRKNAVMWGCNAHNVVNERLGKKEYDCTYIFDEYDCGCGDSPSTEDDDILNVDVEKTESVSIGKGG